MIKEIIHYLFLPSRNRKRLRECVSIISESQGSGSRLESELEQMIKNQDIGAIIDTLGQKGNQLDLSSKQYWLNLYLVARDHKMVDKMKSLENKAKYPETSI